MIDIKNLHSEFIAKIPDQIHDRSTIFLEQKNLVSCVLGPRRSGKTYLLYNKIKNLLKSKHDINSILYINFEDDRMPIMNATSLGKLVDAFLDLYPDRQGDKVFLFFDEIQNVENWSKTLRRCLDSINCEIYITGSSSKMLSREMTTSLRGRTIATTLLPLSFGEHFAFLNIQKSDVSIRKNFAKEKQNLKRFLFSGGFPIVQQSDESVRMQILKEYVSLVLFKDIVERFQVQNIRALDYIVKFCLKNQGKLLSGYKIYNDMKSQGISISKDKLFDYMDHLNEAYLLFFVPIFTDSIRKQNSNPKKVFSIDTGLSQVYEYKKDQDIGRKFENLIYLELLRNNYSVSYYLTNNGQEIDFVATKLGGDPKIFQVCWNIDDPEVYDRERSGMLKAQQELGLKGVLITPENYLKSKTLF